MWQLLELKECFIFMAGSIDQQMALLYNQEMHMYEIGGLLNQSENDKAAGFSFWLFILLCNIN